MKLVSNSAIYFVGSIASRLLSLVALPFLTRALTPQDYGVIALLTMLGVFLCALLGMGLGTSIAEAYFRDQGKQHRSGVIASGFVAIAVTHLLFALAVWPLGGEVSRLLFHTDTYAYVTSFMLIGQIIQNMTFPLQFKIQFEERARLASLAMMLSSSMSVGLIILFVIVERRGLPGYAQAVAIGAISQLFIYLLLSRVDLSSARIAVVRELVRKGWPMILSFLLMFVVQYGIRMPIQWFGGLKTVGLYQVGASLAAPMGLATTAFINAWTPYALGYADKPEQASKDLAKATHFYVLLVGAVVVLMFAASPWLAQLLLAKGYYDSYPVIGLCVLWHYYLSIFILLLPPAYFANDVVRTSVWVQSFMVLLFVCIGMPLIMAWPLIGAGAALALAGLILVFAQLYWNKRKMASTYVQIHYDRSTYALIVLVGVCGALLLAIDILVGRIVSAMVGVAIVALFLRSGFSRADVRFEWRRIRAILNK